MTTDPHELINLPGYGNAEKELRKAGLWRFLDTDTEILDWLDQHSITVRNEMTLDVIIDDACGKFYGEGLRGLIDDVARLEQVGIKE